MADHPLVPLDETIGAAKTTLEAVLNKLGIDPEKARRADADDLIVYGLTRGSAHVVVSLGQSRGAGYVRVAAPVVIVPDDAAKRGPLFERLLELNAKGLSNAAFGLLDGVVIAVSERPLAGLDAPELEQMLTHLSAVADTFDDRLVSEFGVRRASDR